MIKVKKSIPYFYILTTIFIMILNQRVKKMDPLVQFQIQKISWYNSIFEALKRHANEFLILLPHFLMVFTKSEFRFAKVIHHHVPYLHDFTMQEGTKASWHETNKSFHASSRSSRQLLAVDFHNVSDVDFKAIFDITIFRELGAK